MKIPIWFFEDHLSFLRDVRKGMVTALDDPGFTNPDWRKICKGYLSKMNRFIERILFEKQRTEEFSNKKPKKISNSKLKR